MGKLNLIKKVLIFVAAGVVLVGGGVFFGSTQSGASSSWINELTSKANTELGQAGYAKKEEILDKDLTAEMAVVLDPKIAEEEAALEKMLEEYYQLKLQGLQESAQFAELEAKIETIRISIFNRYKTEVDAMFVQ